MLLFAGFLQDFAGAVEVEAFPWNDAVAVVDNESPGEDFSLQPEQDVLKYGSGIVIMQTSWVSAEAYRGFYLSPEHVLCVHCADMVQYE